MVIRWKSDVEKARDGLYLPTLVPPPPNSSSSVVTANFERRGWEQCDVYDDDWDIFWTPTHKAGTDGCNAQGAGCSGTSALTLLGSVSFRA
ncbi:hypothetical protein HaLaN_13361 [Haematococcus lacustris]|uniref:Uncharacterized protein n=1 Tax=Haematococcus lacustris TaxID=44745 RepID=A0A699ZM39_HAELA|nr:hypothetical protein HaLaN_13361 [Haematococcus lacustris]